MKKVLYRGLVLALALCMLLPLLASCAARKDGTVGKGNARFADVYRTDWKYQKEARLSGAKAANLPSNATVTTAVGAFCLYRFTENDTAMLGVYNVDLDATVYSCPDDAVTVQFYDSTCFTVKTLDTEENAVRSTVVYDAEGKLLASADKDVTCLSQESGIRFDDKLFYVKDGKVVKTYNLPAMFDFAGATLFSTEDYLIAKNARKVTYYDQNLSIVAVYEVPEHATGFSLWVLDNGNVLAQYRVACAPTEKYDCLVNGIAYKLYHALYSPKKDRVNDLYLGVSIATVGNRHNTEKQNGLFYEDVFTEKVPNYIGYYPIVDGVVSVQKHFTVLKNNGKLGARLDGFVENQRDLVAPYGEGLFSVLTRDGTVLLDTKGEVVRTIPALAKARAYGYYHSDVIYDHNLAVIESKSNVSSLDAAAYSAAFYYKTEEGATHHYRVDKNGTHEITAPEGRELYTRAYDAVVNAGTYYYVNHYPASAEYQWTEDRQRDYYTYEGELLFSILGDSRVSFFNGRNNTFVRIYDVDGTVRYLCLEGYGTAYVSGK